MKLNKYQKIQIRILLMFTIIIFASLIPDFFHSFFGDVLCTGNLNQSMCPNGWSKVGNPHGLEYHWGYRHWMFISMGISLFIVQLFQLFETE